MWLQRQLNDPYVVQSKKEGYRSRAAYKLIEIDAKFKIFHKHDVVLDLGVSLEWAQVAMKKGAGKIIGLDLLPINPMEDVSFIQADFMTDDAIEKIGSILGNTKINVLLSDMAPNVSGHKMVDHLSRVGLCEEVFAFAKNNLSKGGTMVFKIFQGGADGELLKEIKSCFLKVKNFKPDSSRKESSEIYTWLLASKALRVLLKRRELLKSKPRTCLLIDFYFYVVLCFEL